MITMVGQNVLVIGGTSGIGEAVANLAATLGATVAIASRNAKASAGRPADIRLFDVDIGDRKSVEALFAQLGSLDHVCLTAGPSALTGEFTDIDAGTALTHFNERFWAAFHVAQLAARKLISHGSLTFIIGALSRRPIPGRAMTTAAQCAVEGLARGLAIDLAPTRVNTIVAGLTDTAMWDRLDANARRSLFDDHARRAPAGRVGKPQDVAAMVIGAMTNPYVTGASLVVDGGSTVI